MQTTEQHPESEDFAEHDLEQAAMLYRAAQDMAQEIGHRVVGQQTLVEHLLVTLLAQGHGLFVGLPGLAKTLLIKTLAQTLDLQFNRIQFTPDLMPTDITGTDILETHHTTVDRAFRFVAGPVFCNLLLADEINRTPPKTQAALLQAMQEGQVTATGKTYALPKPFHVFATQNPIEQEGTYPLPEAQLDRFMMMLNVDYPSAQEEHLIVQRTSQQTYQAVKKILNPQTLIHLQALVQRVPVADPLIDRAVRIVRATRPTDPSAPAEIKQWLAYGAGPRAGQHLVIAARARALLQGRHVVDVSDIDTLAKPVLRHRLIRNFQAQADNITTDTLIEHILHAIHR